jgi:hypothetical protein
VLNATPAPPTDAMHRGSSMKKADGAAFRGRHFGEKPCCSTDSKVILPDAHAVFFNENAVRSSHGEIRLNPSPRFELKASTSWEKVSRN